MNQNEWRLQYNVRNMGYFLAILVLQTLERIGLRHFQTIFILADTAMSYLEYVHRRRKIPA